MTMMVMILAERKKQGEDVIGGEEEEDEDDEKEPIRNRSGNDGADYNLPRGRVYAVWRSKGCCHLRRRRGGKW